MTADPLARRFDVACRLAREAGQLALRYFADPAALTIKDKGVQDMASEADVEVERLIRGRLAGDFPDDAFLGEETGASALPEGAGVWVVDPIDGTACFVAGIPSWCVSIGYMRGRTLEIGVIFDPCAGELFAARRGHGATLNGRPIRVSKATSLQQGMTGIGYSFRVKPERITGVIGRLLNRGGIFHRSGSGALTLAYVAAGRLNAYYEPHMNAWDSFAGMALVAEAGGWTSDVTSGDGLTRGAQIYAAAPGVAQALRDLVGSD